MRRYWEGLGVGGNLGWFSQRLRSKASGLGKGSLKMWPRRELLLPWICVYIYFKLIFIIEAHAISQGGRIVGSPHHSIRCQLKLDQTWQNVLLAPSRLYRPACMRAVPAPHSFLHASNSSFKCSFNSANLFPNCFPQRQQTKSLRK